MINNNFSKPQKIMVVTVAIVGLITVGGIGFYVTEKTSATLTKEECLSRIPIDKSYPNSESLDFFELYLQMKVINEDKTRSNITWGQMPDLPIFIEDVNGQKTGGSVRITAINSIGTDSSKDDRSGTFHTRYEEIPDSEFEILGDELSGYYYKTSLLSNKAPYWGYIMPKQDAEISLNAYYENSNTDGLMHIFQYLDLKAGEKLEFCLNTIGDMKEAQIVRIDGSIEVFTGAINPILQ